MGLYDNVKEAAKAKGYSINRLEQELNFARSYISKFKTITPSAEKIQKIADFLEVSSEYLLTGKETESPVLSNVYQIELKRFPMLGQIACGTPKYTNEDRESYVMAGTNIDADFCLRASGDSMVGARICDGDIVFIKKQDMVDNGEIAAVVVNNESEATLKRLYYYQEKALLILKAENPAYEDLIFTNEELNQIHILGKAIAFQSDVK